MMLSLKTCRRYKQRTAYQWIKNLEYIKADIPLFGEQTGVQFPNFSIEMETGTGKTYVYLRTILELYCRYGLRKFIIVVRRLRFGKVSSRRWKSRNSTYDNFTTTPLISTTRMIRQNYPKCANSRFQTGLKF